MLQKSPQEAVMAHGRKRPAGQTTFIFFMVFLLLGAPPRAWSKILISTVAQVENHVITSREVDIHRLLNQVLKPEARGQKGEEVERSLIREWVLFYEASSFFNTSVPTEKIQKLRKKAQKSLASSKTWRNLDVTPSELKEKIRRQLESSRLYAFKKKTSIQPVPLADLKAEYGRDPSPYKNQSFEQVQEKIRQDLEEKTLKERMEQWFQVLEKKYEVRLFPKIKTS